VQTSKACFRRHVGNCNTSKGVPKNHILLNATTKSSNNYRGRLQTTSTLLLSQALGLLTKLSGFRLPTISSLAESYVK
jgi:hypothetical protein